jgi:beta-glucosidase-like glycosyl hydrolase
MDAQRGIARRMIIGLPREGLNAAWEKDYSAYPSAGVILFRRDFADVEALRNLTARLRELARPRRIFIAIDEEGGFVSQLGALLTVPPNALLLARGASPGDIEYASRITGERLRALGIDWAYAPVADVYSEPLNPVIGPRSYGTDPETVTRHLAEVLAGFRASGVAACLKHFPGHGDTELDSHFALPKSGADIATLERRELAPFRAHLDAPSIMTAHVVYPALDPDRPGTFSRAVVTGLLREKLGYRGVAVTDALEMKGATGDHSPAEAARLALEAGCDLLLFAFHHEDLRRVRLELAKALTDGRLDRAGFDAARDRLARFDTDHPEPTATELAKPIDSLTPSDWVPRLERIIERGLVVEGTVPASAPDAWSVEEPDYPQPEPTIASELARLGVTVDEDASSRIVVRASRKPLPADDVAGLQQLCAEHPTIVLGLQNDAFLVQLSEAVLRISASDATPLTRRGVARRLAAEIRSSADARA